LRKDLYGSRWQTFLLLAPRLFTTPQRNSVNSKAFARSRRPAPRLRKTHILAAAFIMFLTGEPLCGQGLTVRQTESLDAWKQIATVLQHPRCLNCHQLNSPLQGNTRRLHIPHVSRGPHNGGVGPMRCSNCHNSTGNNITSRTPGAPNWSLAPVSMLWQGVSNGDLCRMLKDPARNGKRTPKMLVEHIRSEPLVLWGWNPGPDLESVPISHNEFVELMKAWIDGGAACPK
jgi:hypothetical protein